MKDMNDIVITPNEVIGELTIAIASLGFLNYVLNKMVWVIIDLGMIIFDKL